MIYTVTFNPSLDYFVSVEQFSLGRTNRTSKETLRPGGKGINVSTVLKNIGFESIALGFIGGFTGEEIVKRLADTGVRSDFIELPEGTSRINVKLLSIDGTEINGCGPCIKERELQRFLDRINELQSGDVIILSGSIPDSLSDEIYGTIVGVLASRDILTVVDATGSLLMNAIPHKPFLIKPNKAELEAVFGKKLQKREEIIDCACKLQEMGAENVLVSLGAEGAILIAKNGKRYSAVAPKGQLINSVGAGDSMVAGFMAGWLEKGDYRHAFRMGVAAGSASAFSDELASKEAILMMCDAIAEVECEEL